MLSIVVVLAWRASQEDCHTTIVPLISKVACMMHDLPCGLEGNGTTLEVASRIKGVLGCHAPIDDIGSSWSTRSHGPLHEFLQREPRSM